MKYDGTKTATIDLPKQLRLWPELAAAVRFIAGANNRSIQGQILHWMTEAVEKEEEKLRRKKSEKLSLGAQPKSVFVRERQEKSA